MTTLNIIVIVVDSLRQDPAGHYHPGRPAFVGIPACRTPAIDAWAQECVTFTNAYPCNLPAIPTRWELMTGNVGLHSRAWEPRAAGDRSAAEILRRHGYICGLISDTYHYRAPGMNYHRGFHAYEWIRGQEYDPWVSASPRRSIADYVNDPYPEVWRRRVAQYLANTERFTQPDAWFAPEVLEHAVSWLRENRHHERLFLWARAMGPSRGVRPLPPERLHGPAADLADGGSGT